MSTNNNTTAQDATAPRRSWDAMTTPDNKPMSGGDDTRKTGDLPKDPQPKTGNDTANKKY